MAQDPTTISKSDLVAAHRQTPKGLVFYGSIQELRAKSLLPYWQALSRAWRELKLNGVLSVEGLPTLYLTIQRRRVRQNEAVELQRKFWNQGLATVLVVVDPTTVRIYSGLARPTNAQASKTTQESLVQALSLAEYATRVPFFYIRLATGSFYSDHRRHFSTEATVDAFLLNNLRTLRDRLTAEDRGLTVQTAHTFLARILFVSYLVDRNIIDLGDVAECRCETGSKLGEALAALATVSEKQRALLGLFRMLKEDFNGSMFEEVSLAECRQLNRAALDDLINFLLGHELGSGQFTLDFWAYDFSMIPVEIISAVYEDFLKKEDQPQKKTKGAFYTPKFLAETVVDLALRDEKDLGGKTFLDPACGSGIFLVTLFNRLATQWMLDHPKAAYERKADSLKAILQNRLRGIDINPTACRIACFSLYLAFLDCFSPPDIKQYIRRKGKLPNILKYRDRTTGTSLDFPVVYEDDFLNPTHNLPDDIQYIVGNPPWFERGAKKGKHHLFAKKIPKHLSADGIGCLLLPSKTFLNEKTNEFQADWLRTISVDEVVQLADYRKILFKEARCPCMIVRFQAGKPDINTAEIEYVTPKVSRVDAREGVIPVSCGDRKTIQLRRILAAAKRKAAPTVWKNHLWGTPRDIKFLDMLEQLPKLGDIAGAPRENKRWTKGQGIKPFYPNKAGLASRSLDGSRNPWPLTTPFLNASSDFPAMFVSLDDTTTLKERLDALGASYDMLHRSPTNRIFEPPLIVISQGIGKGASPKVAFSNRQVLFQDSLQSIGGPSLDEDLLLFLTVLPEIQTRQVLPFSHCIQLGNREGQDPILRITEPPLPSARR